jgi:hypothetical protein
VLREAFGPKREEVLENRGNYIVRSLVIYCCSHHLANMQLDHLLTCFSLTHPAVPLSVTPVPSACRSVAFSIIGNVLLCVPPVCMLQSFSVFLYFDHTGALFNFLQTLSLFN